MATVEWNEKSFVVVALIFYALGVLRALFGRRGGGVSPDWPLYALLASGVAAQTGAMIWRGVGFARCPVHNLFESTLFVGWTIGAAFVALGWTLRFWVFGRYVGPALLAIAAMALFPNLDGPSESLPGPIERWMALHIPLILLSYGGFGLASVFAGMYLTLDHYLKRDKRRALSTALPPIDRLESALVGTLTLSVLFLTLGLVLGVLWLKRMEGVYFSKDAKVLWSLLVWLVYMALLVARVGWRRRGPRFAWGAISSFIFILLTFWGSNLLSGIHNP